MPIRVIEMAEGEGGDYRYQRLDPAERDDQAQQEQHMVDAGQNVLDAEPDETERGFPPGRIEADSAGPAGDHHSAAGSGERHIANGELDGVAQIGADQALDREDGIGRVDRIGEMSVEIAGLIADPNIRRRRRGNSRDRPVVFLE